MAKKGLLLSLARITRKKHKKIRMDDIVAYFQQLSALLNAGIPLLHSIQITSDQCQSEKLSQILTNIANKVAGGSAFHTATSAYPKVFKSHWIQVIHTGEVSGQLAYLMQQLSDYIQKNRKTQGKVKSAMVYPLILVCVAVLATVIMLWKVVPTFAEFFNDFGTELPAITETVIGISNLIRERGLYIVMFAALLSFGFYMAIRTKDGKRIFDSSLLALPVFGNLLIQVSMEKFATNFSLLLNSGTPLLESLRTVQEVFRDSTVYYEAIGEVYDNVSSGRNLIDSMGATGLFTSMILNMVRVGEESGKLDEVLDQAANYYRDKVESTVTRLTSLIEPLIVIVMGVVFAGLLGSIYIPMFQLASGPGGG